MKFVAYHNGNVGILKHTEEICCVDSDIKEIARYIWNNKRDIVRDIICEDCPECIGTVNMNTIIRDDK